MRIGIEGALMAFSPLPLLFPSTGIDIAGPPLWPLITASIATVTCFICGLTLFRRPLIGKIFGFIASGASYCAAFNYILTNPFAALIGSVILISIALTLIDFRIKTRSSDKRDHVERCLQRAWWGTLTIPFSVAIRSLLPISETVFSIYVISASSVIAQILIVHWANEKRSRIHLLLPTTGIVSIGLAFTFNLISIIPTIILIIAFLNLFLLPQVKTSITEFPWENFFAHPAKILLTTFLGLCVIGTILMVLPITTVSGSIGGIDAAFTSVSAVCVTGLVVLDTSRDFTLFGQFLILVLIQLGGLGIMSITTVALHAMGHRLSLKYERIIKSMADTGHKSLLHSLSIILKFTFIVEGIGTFLLVLLFYLIGDPFLNALWRGVFTAISAFCNAGFALQSNSLIPYQSHPAVLHVVSMLIIMGGLAPATCLIVPQWLKGKKIPISAHIALMTTVILLFAGTIFIMAFEWNGMLAGLSFGNKLHNAWFQSVTLRTAGFNSVEIANVANPTFLIMIFFMFIGGSVGGTAGGVKTTTIGILAMTFWINITNRNEIITRKRHIHSATVYRAVTIVVSGIIIWFLVVLMLEITQQISARNLFFEATSALGTVGLSTGATPFLDEIGKIIIIIAMFVGRIGPVTLFMLLNHEQTISSSQYIRANISLT